MSKLILLCAFALVSHVSLAANPCKDNNAYCQICKVNPETKANNCAMCVFSKNKEREACGANISIDKCMAQDDGSDTCLSCYPGYGLSDDKKSCEKPNIDNCIGVNKTPGNPFRCNACKPGYYSKPDGSACVSGPPDDKKIPNCRSYRENQQGDFTCGICDKDYKVSDDLKCEKAPIEGCISEDQSEGKCSECSWMHGYFQEEPNKCTYKGLPDGIDPLGDIAASKAKNDNKDSTDKSSNLFSLGAAALIAALVASLF